jgi:hypothetical protein
MSPRDCGPALKLTRGAGEQHAEAIFASGIAYARSWWRSLTERVGAHSRGGYGEHRQAKRQVAVEPNVAASGQPPRDDVAELPMPERAWYSRSNTARKPLGKRGTSLEASGFQKRPLALVGQEAQSSGARASPARVPVPRLPTVRVQQRAPPSYRLHLPVDRSTLFPISSIPVWCREAPGAYCLTRLPLDVLHNGAKLSLLRWCQSVLLVLSIHEDQVDPG